MSISVRVKNDSAVAPCSPELILAFLERRTNRADGERALIHLANCPECRKKAAFVCQAMAAEREHILPTLTPEEREAAVLHVDQLVQKNTKSVQQILWECWIAGSKCLSFLGKGFTDPEVMAAGVESSELYFRSVEPNSSRHFWQAALCIGDGTEDNLKIVLTDGDGNKIPAGDFLLCLIRAKVENGICYISKEELAKNLFSGDKKNYFVAFRFPDKTIVQGNPILGTDF